MKSVLFLGALFLCMCFVLNAETVIVKPGDTAWGIHEQFTGNGNNFRYAEYLRSHGSNLETVTFFKSENGTVSRKELRNFKKLQPGDRVIIPDHLTVFKQLPGNNRTVEELCFAFGSPENCGSQIAAINNIKDPNFRFTGFALVPKNFQETPARFSVEAKNSHIRKTATCPDCYWPTLLAWIFGFTSLTLLLLLFIFREYWLPHLRIRWQRW